MNRLRQPSMPHNPTKMQNLPTLLAPPNGPLMPPSGFWKNPETSSKQLVLPSSVLEPRGGFWAGTQKHDFFSTNESGKRLSYMQHTTKTHTLRNTHKCNSPYSIFLLQKPFQNFLCDPEWFQPLPLTPENSQLSFIQFFCGLKLSPNLATRKYHHQYSSLPSLIKFLT